MKTTNKVVILAGAISLLTQLVHAQEASYFTINGQLKNFKKMPDKVFFLYPDYQKKKPDSAVVVNGTYQFKGMLEDDAIPLKLSYGPELEMMSPTATVQTTLIITKGETNVTSDGEIFNVTETGASGKAFDEYENMHGPLFKAVLIYVKEKQSVEYLTREAARSKAYGELKKSSKKYDESNYDFAINHHDAEITALMAYDLSRGTALRKGQADSLITILSSSKNKSELRTAAVKNLQKKADQLSRELAVDVGKKAPDFTQNDGDGKPVKLSDFKSKYLLVDFWASWCAPCRAENPNVVKAYAKYHTQGFDILGVSLDESKEAWLKAIKNDKLVWHQVSDLKEWGNEVAKLYGVVSIPQNFLIDAKGTIVAKNLRSEDLDKKLEELLKTN